TGLAPANVVAVGMDERQVAIPDESLQLLRLVKTVQLCGGAQQAREIAGIAPCGALANRLTSKNVERHGALLVVAVIRVSASHDGRREPAPSPFAGRENGQFG